MINIKKKNYQKNIERIYNIEYHDLLVNMYSEKGMTIREIAEELNISVGTVHNDLNEFGIKKKLKWA